jgi:hypothetical protein
MYETDQDKHPRHSATIVEVEKEGVPIITKRTYAYQFFDSKKKIAQLNIDASIERLEEYADAENVSDFYLIGEFITNPSCDEFPLFSNDGLFEECRYVFVNCGDKTVVWDLKQICLDKSKVVHPDSVKKYIRSWEEIQRNVFVTWDC